ncbi:hypothetical protein BHM03_00013452 [Ensete ventricosum]|nr:hypothetical protein BHM03_00013452 [Ensete ventricosum]
MLAWCDGYCNIWVGKVTIEMEAAVLAWGVTNGGCGYCDPREAIIGLGRQQLVLLRGRASDGIGQREATTTMVVGLQ